MAKKDREANRAARAAAVRREQAARARRQRMMVTAAVLAVLAVIVGVGVALSGGGDEPATPNSSSDVSVAGQALVVGKNADAPKVVVYEDFLCPYCREFESASHAMLRKKADAGKVVVEYRPFQLLPDDYSARSLSVWAAVAQQGTPGQALALHDLLYENQPYESAKVKPSVDDLVDLAKKAGVRDGDVLDAARKPDRAFSDAAKAHATEAGVKGTPTIFVDGKELQGSSIADLVDQVEQLIARG